MFYRASMKQKARNFVVLVGILLLMQFCQAWHHVESCGDGSDESPTLTRAPDFQASTSSSSGRPALGESSFSGSFGSERHSTSCECSTPTTLLPNSSELTENSASGGSVSNMTGQFYDRYQGNEDFDPISLKEVPGAVQRRLNNFSLAFEDLPGLLQRAVLWDSGFVVTEDSRAVKVWTFDDRTMEDIAVSVGEFNATGCNSLSCTQANGEGFQTYSSCRGGPAALLAASKCVVEEFESDESSNETLWSTGGDFDTVPEIRVVKSEGVTDCGCEYIVYSIHTTSSKAASSTTSQCEQPGSLVISCYGNHSVPEAMKARITTPKGEDWVTEWIRKYEDSNATTESSGSSHQGSSSTSTESGEGSSSGFSLWWLLLILLLVLLLIVATIVACRHCHRLSRFRSPPDNNTYIFVGGRMWAVQGESHGRGATYWLRFANWCRKTFNFFS